MTTPWRTRIDNDNPCRLCNIRHIGCHGNCKSYLNWKENKQRLNADDRKNREIINLLRDNEGKRWMDVKKGHKSKGLGRR